MATSEDQKGLMIRILQEIRALREENQAQTRQIRRLKALVRARDKEPEESVTLAESAAVLDKASKTIRNWRSEGRFPKPDSYCSKRWQETPSVVQEHDRNIQEILGRGPLGPFS